MNIFSLLPIALFWAQPGPVPDGFDVYLAQTSEDAFHFFTDAGDPAFVPYPAAPPSEAQGIALDPFEIEAFFGQEMVTVSVALKAYAEGRDDSDLSNVITRRVWGTDLNRSGKADLSDLLLFYLCYYQPSVTTPLCERADFTGNGVVNIPDWQGFASLWIEESGRRDEEAETMSAIFNGLSEAAATGVECVEQTASGALKPCDQ